MASSQTVSGSLDQQDILFPVRFDPNSFIPNISNSLVTRVDEYDVTTTRFGNLNVTLTANDPTTANNPGGYDTFLEIINTNTGEVVESNDDFSSTNIASLISNLNLVGGQPLRIRVTSAFPFESSTDYSYELEADVSLGDITLTPRQVQQGTSETDDRSVRIQGELDSNDYFAPVDINATNVTSQTYNNGSVGIATPPSRLIDEYELQARSGQELTVNLFATDSSSYDTYLEVIEVGTGEIVASNNDINPSNKNSAINVQNGTAPVLEPGKDYRIRVSSAGTFDPNADNSYTLEASVDRGDITLTPIVPNSSSSGGFNSGSSSNNGFDTPFYRFRNTQIEDTLNTSTYLYAGEAERDAILADPNFSGAFQLEGFAFNARTTPGTDLVPVFRYRNTTTETGTYLFATRNDFQQDSDIIQSNFEEDGNGNPAFYAYPAGSAPSSGFADFTRFENNGLADTFIYAGPSESANIRTNFSNGFTDQGEFWAVGV